MALARSITMLSVHPFGFSFIPEILKQLRLLYCSSLSATVSSFEILFLRSMFSVSRAILLLNHLRRH